MRWWMSWVAVAALAALTVYGLTHWTSLWGLLMVGGAPMIVATVTIAAMHFAVNARRLLLPPCRHASIKP